MARDLARILQLDRGRLIAGVDREQRDSAASVSQAVSIDVKSRANPAGAESNISHEAPPLAGLKLFVLGDDSRLTALLKSGQGAIASES